MKAYVYRALFEPGDRRGNVVVTFPDVPEAVTQGRGETDARETAEEALGLVLLSFLSLACGLILDTVTRGRKEAKRIAYLAVPGPLAAGDGEEGAAVFQR